MRKHLVGLVLLLILNLLPACSSKIAPNSDTSLEPEEPEYKLEGYRYIEDHLVGDRVEIEPEIIDHKVLERKLHKLDKSKGMFSNANDLEYINGRLYVVDENKNEIVILDTAGNHLDTWGKLGSKPGEFAQPRDIFYNEKNKEIHILDAGNHRVQTFDMEHNFRRELSLKSVDVGNVQDYINISVNDDNEVIVAANNSVHAGQKLCRLNDKGERYYYPRYFLGKTFAYKGDIYAFDTLEYFFSKDQNKLYDTIAANGKNNLYIIEGDQLRLIGSFPDCYAPSCAMFKDESLFVISSRDMVLAAFLNTEEGLEYNNSLTEPLYEANSGGLFAYSIAVVDNVIYIAQAGKEEGNIYRVSLNE